MYHLRNVIDVAADMEASCDAGSYVLVDKVSLQNVSYGILPKNDSVSKWLQRLDETTYNTSQKDWTP
jgi:hypothetical protein